jgi:ferredoxin
MSTSRKLSIDQSKCIQCGTCVAAYPELFEFEENGTIVRVKASADFTGKDFEEIKNTCPNGAIIDAETK